MAEDMKKSIDSAALHLIEIAEQENLEMVWDRKKQQQPHCGFGTSGVCCRICTMGPCRITKKANRGVCGATADVIVARNFARMVAAGAASHSDHGRAVAETFLAAARKETEDYTIKDTKKLLEVAPDYGVDTTVKGEKR